MNHMPLLPILLPLLTAILLLLTTGRGRTIQRSISSLSIIAQTLIAINLLSVANTDAITVYILGNWVPPFGIVLVLDRLSTLMVFTTSTLALFCIFYATRNNDKPGDSFHSVIHFLLMGINGAFLTGDLFNLFVFFEVLLIASYTLLLHGGGAARIKSGLHYVVLNLIGSSLFLIAVAILYSITGTLNMADLAVKVAHSSPDNAPLLTTAALLLFVVFGLKAAMVPLYFWLPRAYATAAAPVAALFAIMTKIGIYAIIRVYPLIFGDNAGELSNIILPWLWPLSLVTLALGVTGALAARELRLQISYFVIVSVGTLMAGIAINTQAALSATMYYLVHSTWICGAFFLLADLIMRQRGAAGDRITLGSILPQAVLLGSLFFIAAASLAGMPPLSGFIGKVMLLQSVGLAEKTFWLWLVILLGSLAIITALGRSGSTLFWRTQNRVAKTPNADKGSLIIVITMLSLSLILSIAGEPITRFTDKLAEQILMPQNYIQQVLQTTAAHGEKHD